MRYRHTWATLRYRHVGALAALVAATLVGPSAVRAQKSRPAFPPGIIVRIDSLARAQLALDGVGGMTIGIVTEAGVVWTNSYGYADMARQTPTSRETVYRIGSITKQFTAIMLRQLASRHLVGLSDAADRYLPALDSVPHAGSRAHRITLLQLATMTSGLAQEPDDEDRYTRGPLDRWEQSVIAALRHTTLNAEPGTAWEYSNIGYAALGAALERAASVPYIDYVREQILMPLGMTHTGFVLDSAMRVQLATGYAMGQGTADTTQPRRELTGRGYKVPNGGLFSTVDDLAAFVRFEMGLGPDRVLPRAEVARHFAALTYATPDLSSGYGVGFHAIRHGSIVALGHPGSVAGYLSAAYFDPVTRTGAIVLRNVDDPHFDVLGLCLQVLELASAARN